jgi:hypothetical protein
MKQLCSKRKSIKMNNREKRESFKNEPVIVKADD